MPEDWSYCQLLMSRTIGLFCWRCGLSIPVILAILGVVILYIYFFRYVARTPSLRNTRSLRAVHYQPSGNPKVILSVDYSDKTHHTALRL